MRNLLKFLACAVLAIAVFGCVSVKRGVVARPAAPEPAPAAETASPPVADSAVPESAPAPAPSPAETAPAPAASAEPAAVPEPPPKTYRTITVRTPVLTKRSSYFADGLLDEYVTYAYADDGTTLVGEKRFDASRPDAIERSAYAYSGGRLVSKTSYDAEGKIEYRHEYLRDGSGILTRDTTYDAAGKAISVSAYEYDADGNKILWTALDGTGIVLASTKYEYDGRRLLRIGIRDPAGKEGGSVSVEYDASGNQAKRSSYLADGALEKYEIYRYAEGKLAEESSFRASGGLASRVGYSYDADGAMIKRVTENSAGKVLEREEFLYNVRERQETIEEGSSR